MNHEEEGSDWRPGDDSIARLVGGMCSVFASLPGIHDENEQCIDVLQADTRLLHVSSRLCSTARDALVHRQQECHCLMACFK